MIRRDSYFEIINEFIDTNFIKIFTGIRRSGKTTLLHSIVDELKNRGTPSENIFYISFESMKYQNIDDSIKLNNLIIKLIEEVDGKYYFFFEKKVFNIPKNFYK